MRSALRIILCFIFISAFQQNVSAQTNLSGNWKGTIYIGTVSFAVIMTIEQNGNALSGSYNELASYDDIYANFAITGTINQDSVKLNDAAVISEFSKGQSKWVKKNFLSDVHEINGVLTMRGMWETEGRKVFDKTKLIENYKKSVPAPDSFVFYKITYVTPDTVKPVAIAVPETIIKKDTPAAAIVPAKKLTPADSLKQKAIADIKVTDYLNNKQNPVTTPQPATVTPSPSVIKPVEKRSIVIKKTIDVFSDSLKLSFYDNGEIDNDTISVWYNGKLIISKQMLKTAPLEYTIHLDPHSENLLEMYADNLGSVPPNTALLIFYDKGQRREVRIDSDTKSTGAVVLRKKE